MSTKFRRWLDLPIKRKLNSLTALTACVVLLVACEVFVVTYLVTLRQTMVQELSAQAKVIGTNSINALLSHDEETAIDLLNGLRLQLGISTAILYDRTGEVLGTFLRHQNEYVPPQLLERNGYQVNLEYLELAHPIMFDGVRLGTIYLKSDINTLYVSIAEYASIAGALLIALTLFAFMVSSKLRNSISDPILELTTLVKRVSAEKNFSLRAAKRGEDEMGTLIDGFNDMLRQLQKRDKQLENHGISLEELVAVRTSELNRLSQEQEHILEAAGEGIYGTDQEGIITFINPMAARLVGWERQELVGQSEQHIWGPQQRDMSPFPGKQWNAEEWDTEISSLADSRVFWRKDGTSFPAEFTRTPIQDQHGQEIGTVVTFKDITVRKQAEDAIRDSDGRFRKIFNHSNDAIFVIDLEWHQILEANPRAAAMFEYSPSELRHKSISTIQPDEESYIEAFFQTVKEEGHGWTDQLTCRTKTGRRLSAEISASSLEMSQKSCILALIRDVTDRKQREEEVTRFAHQLESKNHELSKARDEALAAATTKSEFLATVSHEIRTPMNGVIGMISLLLETELTRDQQYYAETVRNSGEALLSIINDILDFSKLEAGKFDLEIIDFDLQTVVEETLDLMAERAASKNLALTGVIFPDVSTSVRGDPGRLRQILLNLISNAIKFTESGEVTLQILRIDETDEEIRIRVQVSDTGIGIAPNVQTQLFRSFSQADSSTTRKYGGTGLGLAICKQLVELMGGEVGVESRVGQGSLFWFSVPLEKQSAHVQITPLPHVDLKGLHICCVDDHPPSRYQLAQYSEDWGMQVTTTSTAAEALATLHEGVARKKPFDIAILDTQIPGMDALALARVIKADPVLASIKLVLLTTLGRPDEHTDAQHAGFAGYLTKPVRKAQLEACLTRVVAGTEVQSTEDDPTGETSFAQEVEKEDVQTDTRILVVDDHGVNQQLAGLMLERLGHRVDIASNGKEAVDVIHRVSYDLVLMDCQMPVMDGYEATKAIRREEEDQNNYKGKGRIPIIAMTANAMQGDREKCLAAGMDDYLPKPIKPQDIENLLEKWLPRRKASGRSPNQAHEDSSEISSESPIDPTQVEEWRVLIEKGQIATLMQMAQQFIQEAMRCGGELETAIEEGNPEGLAQTAQSLESLCRQIGAHGLAATASQLARLGQANQWQEVGMKFRALEKEFEQVRQSLETEIGIPS